MKLNYKNLILVDILVVIIAVLFFFKGQKIVDALYSGPEKQIYQNMMVQVTELDNSVATLDQKDLNSKIEQIDSQFIQKSDELFGVKLEVSVNSENDANNVLTDFHKKHVFEGERTLLSYYIGEIIKTKTDSEWVYDNKNGFYLNSNKNQAAISPRGYIEYRYNGGNITDVKEYIDTSIKMLGGEK